ncbi:MAG: hypothetical protein J6K19_09650, partial [Prevotella sp.]|nr:hypothetical protein [Prevotella sp.]
STIFIANEQINQYKFLHKSQKMRCFCAATSFAAALLSVSSKSLSKRLGNFPSAKSGKPEYFCFSCGYCGAGRQQGIHGEWKKFLSMPQTRCFSCHKQGVSHVTNLVGTYSRICPQPVRANSRADIIFLFYGRGIMFPAKSPCGLRTNTRIGPYKGGDIISQRR